MSTNSVSGSNISPMQSWTITGIIGGVICAAAAGPVAGVAIGVFGAIGLVGCGTAVGATVGVAGEVGKATRLVGEAAAALAVATTNAGIATAKKVSQCVNLVQCVACTGLFGALALANRWHVNQMNCEGPSPSSECAPYKYLTGSLVMTSVGLGVSTLKKMVQWQRASEEEGRRVTVRERCKEAFEAAKSHLWF